MKWHNVFRLSLFFCLLTGNYHVQAATFGEPLIPEEQQNSEIVINSRFQELSRGINLSGWFNNSYYFDPNYITEKDLQLIKGLGLEHVRLPIAPNLLFDENNPQILNAEYQIHLDNALNRIEAAGLSAIINLQAPNEFKNRLATDDIFVDSVAQFWRSLATHLSTRNPDQVFLEVINEPGFSFYLRNDPTVDPVERWQIVQTKLANAIHEGAPNHTVILKGHDSGETINSLLQLTPIKDSETPVVEATPGENPTPETSETPVVDTTPGENPTPETSETPVVDTTPGEELAPEETQKPSEKYIYNFHFYETKRFTHQGATWIDEEFSFIKNLPYPFNEEVCAAAVAEITDETAKNWAQDYCDQKWDIARLEKRIALAANWAQEHNVLLTANEFGVYREFVRPEDRAAWLRDVRSLFEKYNIGWAMWDYGEGFGLVRENENGDRIVDENIATALGLTVPPILPPEEVPIIIPQDVPRPKSVPEPSAIAGFLVLTYMGRKLNRRV